jgi:hypothetical protein
MEMRCLLYLVPQGPLRLSPPAAYLVPHCLIPRYYSILTFAPGHVSCFRLIVDSIRQSAFSAILSIIHLHHHLDRWPLISSYTSYLHLCKTHIMPSYKSKKKRRDKGHDDASQLRPDTCKKQSKSKPSLQERSKGKPNPYEYLIDLDGNKDLHR